MTRRQQACRGHLAGSWHSWKLWLQKQVMEQVILGMPACPWWDRASWAGWLLLAHNPITLLLLPITLVPSTACSLLGS